VNTSLDMSKTIAPKSDQLNADDLIAGPRTITITGVRGSDNPDQPVSVFFEGDDGKPYKPCKSMRRVMVHCWGAEAREYVGRRATLYCDPNVVFGGVKVGGIRISHMSHIDRPKVIPLTVTKAKRTPYEVKPLAADVKPGPRQAERRPPPQQSAPPPSMDLDEGYQGDQGDDPWDHVAWAEAQTDAVGTFTDEAQLRQWWGDISAGEDFQDLRDADEGLALSLKATVQKRIREIQAASR
jgi:hypothetical protein